MVNLAVVGVGGMGLTQLEHFKKIPGCKLRALCDSNAEKLNKLARAFNVSKQYTKIDELLEDPDVDAVSIVTPDPYHLDMSLKVMGAGKHVLCEKPLALTYSDAREMEMAAKKNGVINMVNFTYRNAPAIHAAKDLVKKGDLGEIMHVEGHYLQSWLSSKIWGDWRTSPTWLWRLSSKHGSKGVLGDIGVHLLDFASHPVGAYKTLNCSLKTFSKYPKKQIGEYLLDTNDSAVITVEYVNGALGSLTCTRWATGHVNSVQLKLHGTQGALRIDLDKAQDQLEICRGKDKDTAQWKTLKSKKTPNIYERFIQSIQTGINDQPDFAQGATIQKAIDACFLSDKKKSWVNVETEGKRSFPYTTGQ